MEIVILTIGTILTVVVAFFYNDYLNRKRIQEMIIQRFGGKPEYKDYDFDDIKILWKELKDERCKGDIDDITWNDLNMNDVFARINMCCSSIGEQYLYKSLRNTNFNSEKLNNLEEKIRYLDKNKNTRIDVQKKLLYIGKRNNNYHVVTFLKCLDSFKLNRCWIYYFLQIMLLIVLVLAVVFRNNYAYLFLGIVFFINISVYALMKNKYEINMDLMVAVQSVLQVSKEFTQKEETIFSEFKEYTGTINKLTHSMALINGRYQRQYTADFVELGAMYLTGAFLFDFIVYNRVIIQLEEKLTDILALLNLLGEIDMAISIASFRNSVPLYCLPEFCKENKIYYQELYNPLLDNPICNDFNLNTNCIITGSNASGKSTFIKAIAINGILAMNIHTCTAKSARISKAEIYTSMAIRDDLLAGDSYFVKEVKSLQRIIDIIEQDRFVVAIIDEILRGTNTKERVAASVAILRYLENKNCIVIVASHDIELIDLLKNSKYDNYYFCEKSENREVLFDYRIHKGVCKQNNAIKLLDLFGYPSAIVKEANKYSSIL
ncbi:hypothetical protein FYJ34_12100 [Clostridiaceae bacterium 68-1-5]|uniref:DNA mismatch repair proteins mutS family domain-containing protein n=1 Tax=Suipraeoptans intestinalis TaxID=2606628 RepID=A0A6N7V420_9FIRM|nr:hypothetical protein [Suipraeoptans intestinalis]MSR94897.1 hypothetical protein [Suipraeoptans intestinalis]